jgi:hypothetical protein
VPLRRIANAHRGNGKGFTRSLSAMRDSVPALGFPFRETRRLEVS